MKLISCKIFAVFCAWTFSSHELFPIANSLPVLDMHKNSEASSLSNKRNETNSELLTDLALHVEPRKQKDIAAKNDSFSFTHEPDISQDHGRNHKEKLRIQSKEDQERLTIEEKIASWLLKNQNKQHNDGQHSKPKEESLRSNPSSVAVNLPLQPQNTEDERMKVLVEETPNVQSNGQTLETSKASLDDSDIYDQYYYYYYEIDDDDANLVDESSDLDLDSKKGETTNDIGEKTFEELKNRTNSENTVAHDNVDNKNADVEEEEEEEEEAEVLEIVNEKNGEDDEVDADGSERPGSTAETTDDVLDTGLHSITETRVSQSQSKDLGIRIIIPVHSVKNNTSKVYTEEEMRKHDISSSLTPDKISAPLSQEAPERHNDTFSRDAIDGQNEQRSNVEHSRLPQTLNETAPQSHKAKIKNKVTLTPSILTLVDDKRENTTNEDELQSTIKINSSDKMEDNVMKESSQKEGISIVNAEQDGTTRKKSSIDVTERDSRKKAKLSHRARANTERSNDKDGMDQNEMPKKITISLRKRNESSTNQNLTDDSSNTTNYSRDVESEKHNGTRGVSQNMNELIMKSENNIRSSNRQNETSDSNIGFTSTDFNETMDTNVSHDDESNFKPSKTTVSENSSLLTVTSSNNSDILHEDIIGEILLVNDTFSIEMLKYDNDNRTHSDDSVTLIKNETVILENYMDLENVYSKDERSDENDKDDKVEVDTKLHDINVKENKSLHTDISPLRNMSDFVDVEKEDAISFKNQISDITNISQEIIASSFNRTISKVSKLTLNALPRNTNYSTKNVNNDIPHVSDHEPTFTSLPKSEKVPRQQAFSEHHPLNVTEEFLDGNKSMTPRIQGELEIPDVSDQNLGMNTSGTSITKQKVHDEKDEFGDVPRVIRQKEPPQDKIETSKQNSSNNSSESSEKETRQNEILSNQTMDKNENDVTTEQRVGETKISQNATDTLTAVTAMSDELRAKTFSETTTSRDKPSVPDETPFLNHRPGSPPRRVVRTVGGLPYWEEPNENDIPPVSAYRSQDFSLSKPAAPSSNSHNGTSEAASGHVESTGCPVGCQGQGFESMLSGGQAAVSAVMTSHFGPTKDKIIPFDLVLLDLADNYDNSTGMFICTIPGTYVISLYLMSHPGAKVNARIFINNRPIAALWADDSKTAGFYPSSSTQTIAQLGFGDQVYVMLVDGGYGDSWVHANYNAFTIFLLREQFFT